MRRFAWRGLVAGSLLVLTGCSLADEATPGREISRTTDQWAIRLIPGTDPERIATDHGLKFIRQIGSLKNTYLYKQTGTESSKEVEHSLKADLRIEWVEQQLLKQFELKPESVRDKTD